MLSKCNVFKEGLEDSYKKIFVSKKDRMQLDTSSKGSQIRWHKDNIFIKLDCLGYEGISEELVSKLLDYSNVEHVQYEVCEIYEDNKFIGNGCYSFNFLNEDEQVFTFASILKKYSRDYATFNYDEVFEAMYDATGFDVRIYLDHCICIDAIVKNEDRHFNNLAIIRCSNGKFRAAPLFDNGLACLSDTFTFPYDVSLQENLANVYAKPFYTSFERQLKLVHDVIKIDKLKFLNSINKKRYGRAFDVLIYGLETMEGLAWR